jgi:hypothetical protein
MNFLSSFFEVDDDIDVASSFATDAIEKQENQITPEIFVHKMGSIENKDILKQKTGSNISTRYSNMDLAYYDLYEGLISLDIITEKITKGAIVTGTPSPIITPDKNKLTSNALKNSVESSSNPTIKNIINEFEIDYKKLSIFLTEYNYTHTDEYKAITKVPVVGLNGLNNIFQLKKVGGKYKKSRKCKKTNRKRKTKKQVVSKK